MSVKLLGARENTMEVGTWDEREVGRHTAGSVHPPPEADGRAPVVEEDSKGDNGVGGTP